GGLDCLANPVKLSMSPQRSKLVAATRDSVNRLVYGAEALLEGYRAFLLLAGNHSSPRLRSLQDELPLLTTRFEALKQTISSRLETIIHPLHTDEALPLPEGTFGQWMAACHQLQSCLQALNRPKVEQVRSVHDLIFALHSRFVEALAPVTLASGQGRLSTTTYINHVDCTTPGSEKVPLLTPTTKTYIEASLFSGVVINMDHALIVNLSFGGHVGIIELLENAEGGKGRTLRLKFSDLGYKYQPGKVKRMWFLVQLLKAIGLDENSDNMKLSCNAAAGGIIVECTQMKSKKDMQVAFEKLLTAIYALSDLDVYMQDIAVFEEDPSHWSFGLLVQRLDSDFTTEVERFAFQHYLFSMAYKFPSAYRRIQRINSDSYQLSGCYQFLSYHQQQLIDHGRRLAECATQSDDHIREMFMSDEINEVIRRELLHHLLLSDYKNATPLVDLVYDLVGECFVIEPSYCYHPVFKIPPGQQFSDHKEKVTNILLKQGLQYASQRLRNDKDLVLSIIAKYPDDLECVSRELKNDKDVVMTAIKQDGDLLQYASPEFQDNDEIVVAAIKQSGSALEYASDRIRSDKNIIQIVIADKVRFLKCASKTLLKDREYILGLIKHTPRALMYVDYSLESDDTFLRSAIRTNPEVIKQCWALSHKLKRLAQKSQCS
ncbi:DUF4116 domain-containing protein, partial [Endozoicomonas sp. ONNA2]|uniref:DUF4116 domain-containing protein n=1 Tax=Endozoicomonas sp. ONNA2 TaxID=2828741 RepID=UPI0021479346